MNCKQNTHANVAYDAADSAINIECVSVFSFFFYFFAF